MARSAAVLSAIATTFVFSGTAQAFEWGVAPSTTKVLPQNPITAAKAATVKAAGNEWEAFQIVVKSAEGEKNVNVTIGDLTGPGGAVIGASNARLYREHFLDVTEASSYSQVGHERAPGSYPDPLIPLTDPYRPGGVPAGAPFDIDAGGTAAVFVDLYVPAGSAPGGYSGMATLTAEGRAPVEIPVALTVWEFDIPKERSIGTAFGFNGNVRAFHGGPSGDPAPGYDEISDRYFFALHEHRIDPTDLPLPSVSFTFDSDGNLDAIDWTAYDAALAPWLDGTKFPDGVPVRKFNEGYFRPGYGQGSMTADQWAKGAAALAQHLSDRGWWDKAYVYGIDEPWLNGGDKAYAQIKTDSDLLNKYTDLWARHVLITGPYDPRIVGDVGIWCPVTPMYEDWFYVGAPKPGRKEYAERFALGESLWFYVCNADFPPYAGYDIDTAIGYEPRIVKWGAWYERASGFLFWSTQYWVDDDPWNVYRNDPQFGPLFARNGDGFIFYPGDHNGTAGGKGSPPGVAIDGPVVSYRMKQIRDGFEDWEMFNLAEKLGADEYVRRKMARVYIRFGDFFLEDCKTRGNYCPDHQPWTLDETVLLQAREKIALKVQYLTHPDRYPDPEIEFLDAGAPADSGPEGDGGGGDASQPADSSAVAPERSGGGCGCATLES